MSGQGNRFSMDRGNVGQVDRRSSKLIMPDEREFLVHAGHHRMEEGACWLAKGAWRAKQGRIYMMSCPLDGDLCRN